MDENCPIDALKTVAEVKQEPYSLPGGFQWCCVNVLDPVEVSEVYTLLTENYVEDDDNMFRYSTIFLSYDSLFI
jgi:glycylpeptide N-tetradecanoyltransferase